MATDREAARRQRLRGAQTREPQNIDFAFTLPAPPPPVPAARVTRSGATPSPGRAARTPAAAAGSGRKRAAPPTAGDDGGEKRQRVDNTGESPPIGDNAEIDVPSVVLEDVAAEVLATALAQENMTPPRAIDELDELSSIYEMPQTSSRRSRSSRSGLDILEEVAESPMHAPGSGQRQTITPDPVQAQHVRLRDVMGTPTRLPRNAVEADESPMSARGAVPEQTHTIPSPELERRPGTVTATPRTERRQEDDDDEIDELSPDQPANTRAEARFSDEEEADEPEEAEDDEEEEEASEIPDAEAAAQLHSRRRQPSIDLEEEDSPEDSDPEPDISPAARHQTSGKRLPASLDARPPKASPAQQRAPKARMTAPKPKPAPAKKAGAAKKQPGPRSSELIPVTAYRMTRAPTAPSDSDDDDILSAAVPFPSRRGVNAVDVLSQVCAELLSSAVDALSQGAQRADEDGAAAERREYRTKLRAVEAWGEEVRGRLLELTVALDAEYAVRKRVRAAVRGKVELRGELLRIRAERERVAIRMDGVRMRHEEEGARAETLTSLSTTLHDIALAASLGRDAAADAAASPSPPSQPPLPVLLDQVAALASSSSSKGGLLKRLREFNGFLERVAGAVEGR